MGWGSVLATAVIGGIEFINTLYAQTNSREASDNLFAVIFDYAVSEVGDKKKTGQTGTTRVWMKAGCFDEGNGRVRTGAGSWRVRG